MSQPDMPTSDIEEFAAELFSKPPGDACTYKLEMDLDWENAAGIAEVLVILFSKGVQIQFGGEQSSVNINNLSSEHTDLLQKYFNSIGFQMFIGVEHCDLDMKSHFTIENSQLSGTVFNLYRNAQVSIFKLWFDFLPGF